MFEHNLSKRRFLQAFGALATPLMLATGCHNKETRIIKYAWGHPGSEVLTSGLDVTLIPHNNNLSSADILVSLPGIIFNSMTISSDDMYGDFTLQRDPDFKFLLRIRPASVFPSGHFDPRHLEITCGIGRRDQSEYLDLQQRVTKNLAYPNGVVPDQSLAIGWRNQRLNPKWFINGAEIPALPKQ